MFEILAAKELEQKAPLAERMKPESLEDFFGQHTIVGKDKLLTKLIEADRMGSIVLYGPSGSGKTSLARIIAKKTKAEFVSLNAVTSGVKDIRDMVQLAKNNLSMYQKRTILFIDEIHRFNKSQQDALLPFVEDGTLVLIGATTENPYFEVNSALLSRSSVFRLERLEVSDIVNILKRALSDETKGMGGYAVEIEPKVIDHIAEIAGGDARRALNVLELSILSKSDLSGRIVVTHQDVEACVQMNYMTYDKSGDSHYDIVSAFIKSMRGSDPDAAVYYLGKMIYGGEDPRFIARRIVICASEDVGNADPMALVVANNAAQAVDFIGMPEGRIVLAQAAIYVATAPKSNAAYNAINSVLEDLAHAETGTIPYYLKDGTSLKLERKYGQSGQGKKYLYPHDYEMGYVKQQYLPDTIQGKRYYVPKTLGHENKIIAYLEQTKYKK